MTSSAAAPSDDITSCSARPASWDEAATAVRRENVMIVVDMDIGFSMGGNATSGGARCGVKSFEHGSERPGDLDSAPERLVEDWSRRARGYRILSIPVRRPFAHRSPVGEIRAANQRHVAEPGDRQPPSPYRPGNRVV